LTFLFKIKNFKQYKFQQEQLKFAYILDKNLNLSVMYVLIKI